MKEPDGTMTGTSASRSEPTSDPFSFIAPELRAIIGEVQQVIAPIIPVTDGNLSVAREAADGIGNPPLASVGWTKRVIPGCSKTQIPIYIINAKRGAKRPGILYCHGGGFVMGSAASAIRRLQEFTKSFDCAIVAVEYRLAPETRWQGSLEDNYTALRWMHENADELGVDPLRVAVMGESAGGGHAALLAIHTRDRGEFPIAFQCLTAPMLDDRTGSTRQVPPHIGTLVWDTVSNRLGWRSFLGCEPGGDAVPARAVPARALDLSGLPPAWICVGSVDLFVQENVAYAKRLIEAGVSTELFVVPGAFHGFQYFGANTSFGKYFAAAQLGAFRRAVCA